MLSGSLLGCSLCRRPEEAAGSRATASLPSQSYLQSSLTPPEVQTCALTVTPRCCQRTPEMGAQEGEAARGFSLWGRAKTGLHPQKSIHTAGGAHSQHQAGLQQMCCGVGWGGNAPQEQCSGRSARLRASASQKGLREQWAGEQPVAWQGAARSGGSGHRARATDPGRLGNQTLDSGLTGM